ncbi:MAG TPA: FtsX-like permease family protein [Aestuariivirga sp.]|nr:FtsX-like permease family protein [Aestuariivirga sp.]
MLWLRFALRDLRSGLQGFWIFLACLALGTAVIAMVAALSAAINRGIEQQGQPLLGGDLEFALTQREASAAELAHMQSLGVVGRVVSFRAMATTPATTALTEVKAVDDAYPLYGAMKVSAGSLAADLAATSSGFGAVADPLLLGRLGLKVGDTLTLGQARLTITAELQAEPDRLGEGFLLGPRLLISDRALAATGLIQPGSLVTWKYRVKMTDPAEAKPAVETANRMFPAAGWRLRAAHQAASGTERMVERLGFFLTLVGLAALVIGGAGIANAVKAFIQRRTTTIATYKALGAASRTVFAIFLTELLLVGFLALSFGLALGAATPALAQAFLADLLPLPLATGIEWLALARAGVMGLLVMLAFTVLPLAATGAIPATALFRHGTTPASRRFPFAHAAASAVFMALLAGLVLLSNDNLKLSGGYLAGLALSFAALSFFGWAFLRFLRLIPRPRHLLLRQALAALARPGSPALAVILALGLGLGLFAMLAQTDATMSREVRGGLAEKAPAFFFLDVRGPDLDRFLADVKAEPGVIATGTAPMLRGRISAVKGVPADQVKPAENAQWALRGERGLTYSATLPENSTLVAGQWWPADYSGPPLVSLVDDIARGLALKIGDDITVNVLGRDVTARVANLRAVNWRSFGINFVMVFSPNTLKAAPHSDIVTVTMQGGDEAHLLNTMARAWPGVTAVRVKDALDQVAAMMGKILLAIRSANVLTLVTGILVLAGALSAGLSARSYEAVVLKTYGASRAQLLGAFALEYGLLGLAAAVFGLIAGTTGAWFLAGYILELPFAFSPGIAAATVALALILTIAGGLLATNRALTARPSVTLRDE